MAETFAAAFRDRAACRAVGDDAVAGWLFGVARHQLSGYYRRGAVERDQLSRRARIERRSLTARFQLQVECHPSVERVTIQSPRDIRTLVPSERGHVVFALYDDTFSSGEIVLTAHMRDGRTHTERLASAF